MYLAVEVSFVNMGKMKGEGTHFTSKKTIILWNLSPSSSFPVDL